MDPIREAPVILTACDKLHNLRQTTNGYVQCAVHLKLVCKQMTVQS